MNNPREIVDQLEEKIAAEQAGDGETILVLAIGQAHDGKIMRRDIMAVKPGAEVIVATGPEDIEGRRPTHFVLTPAFAQQRSIRMVMAAERATHRTQAIQRQKGL